MSQEADNLLLATLSAGMVGIGDRSGAEDKENLLHAVRSDGVIIKPDTPLLPIDAMYTAGSRRPMIAAAHTDHGALRTGYVFSYGRGFEAVSVAFTPAQVGVPPDVYVYDARSRTARRLAASDAFTFGLAPNATAYFVVAPVSRAGIALLGDEGKFVPDGRKRVAALADEPDRLTATVMFAPQEQSPCGGSATPRNDPRSQRRPAPRMKSLLTSEPAVLKFRCRRARSRCSRAPAGTPCVKRSFPCTVGEPTMKRSGW